MMWAERRGRSYRDLARSDCLQSQSGLRGLQQTVSRRTSRFLCFPQCTEKLASKPIRAPYHEHLSGRPLSGSVRRVPTPCPALTPANLYLRWHRRRELVDYCLNQHSVRAAKDAVELGSASYWIFNLNGLNIRAPSNGHEVRRV